MRSSGAHQHADGRDVGGVAADEGKAGVRAVEFGQLPLEVAVHQSLARDQPARRHRRPALVDGSLGRFGDGRLLVEPQIVVGGEVDELAALVPRRGPEPAVVGAIERVLQAEHARDAAMLVHRLEDVQLAEGNCRLVRRRRLRSADCAERLRKRASGTPDASGCLLGRFEPGRLTLAQPHVLVGHLVPFISAPDDSPTDCNVGSILTALQRSRCSCGYRLNQTEIEGDGHPIRVPNSGRFYACRARPSGATYKLARTHGQAPANVALSRWTWSNRRNPTRRDPWSA